MQCDINYIISVFSHWKLKLFFLRVCYLLRVQRLSLQNVVVFFSAPNFLNLKVCVILVDCMERKQRSGQFTTFIWNLAFKMFTVFIRHYIFYKHRNKMIWVKISTIRLRCAKYIYILAKSFKHLLWTNTVLFIYSILKRKWT